MRATLFLAAAAALLSTSVPSAQAGDVSNIVQSAEYYWRYYDRYRVVPSGCYRQSWDKPWFFVCSSRLSASQGEAKDAHRELERRFNDVRVNSRKRDWDVFDHNEVRESADFWTLEHGEGCSRPGDDKKWNVCLVIAVGNEKKGRD